MNKPHMLSYVLYPHSFVNQNIFYEFLSLLLPLIFLTWCSWLPWPHSPQSRRLPTDVSDVSREWPRAPPLPGPVPVTETRNTRTPESGSVRIRTRRSGEYSWRKMAWRQQTLWRVWGQWEARCWPKQPIRGRIVREIKMHRASPARVYLTPWITIH